MEIKCSIKVVEFYISPLCGWVCGCKGGKGDGHVFTICLALALLVVHFLLLVHDHLPLRVLLLARRRIKKYYYNKKLLLSTPLLDKEGEGGGR